MLILVTWPEVVFVCWLPPLQRYLHFPPFPHCTILKKVTLPSTLRKSRSLYPPKLFKILLPNESVCSPRFIYSSNHLFIITWTHVYSLCTSDCNPILSVCSNDSRFSYWVLFQLASVSLWHTEICVCVCWVLSYFWELQDVPCSFCILPIPVLDVVIHPRGPVFFL